jgi:hypothetical protein
VPQRRLWGGASPCPLASQTPTPPPSPSTDALTNTPPPHSSTPTWGSKSVTHIRPALPLRRPACTQIMEVLPSLPAPGPVRPGAAGLSGGRGDPAGTKPPPRTRLASRVRSRLWSWLSRAGPRAGGSAHRRGGGGGDKGASGPSGPSASGAPSAPSTGEPLTPLDVDARGCPITAEAKGHRDRYRVRCPSCTTTFCASCTEQVCVW